MKKLFVFLFILTSGMLAFAQQDVILPIDNNKGKEQGDVTVVTDNTEDIVVIPNDDICFKCWDTYNVDTYVKEITFPFPVTVYGMDLDSVKKAAKEQILEYAFARYKEYNYGTRLVLINHAEEFVSVKFADYVVQTSKKEKKQKKGNYKFFLEKAKVNVKLVECLAGAIDEYMSDNVVVLYHPIEAKVDMPMFEEARLRLQSEYVNKEYKRTSVQNIDAMPVCKVKETDTSSINYYRELLECVKSEKGIDAKIAVVVRGIQIKKITNNAGVYLAEVEVHAQAFNANTNSFVMDEYRISIGGGASEKQAKLTAISLIFKEFTTEYMWEEGEKYYNAIADGKDFYVFIPDCYTEDEAFAFKQNIKKHSCIKVTNENNVTGGLEIKCKTWIPLQSDIVDELRVLKPSAMTGKLFIRSEYIEVECKK